jgi:hypothetical protein
MPSYCTRRRRAHQIETLRNQFAQTDGLAFANLLTVDRIERALREENAVWSERVYTPLITLWAFLTQVISADTSCRTAVARVLAWLVSQGLPSCSPRSDPYCKARQRLPESLLVRLTCETGRELHDLAQPEWRWKGRRVKLGDGSTCSMPDTPANQKAYPQARTQKPGVGFPILRLMVVFCLATGSVINAAMCPYRGKKTGENSLLRGMLDDTFEPGDIFLADRYFSSYFDAALLGQHGVDVVVRGHQLRKRDYRIGERLGRMDHIVVWPKPKRPAWMDQRTYVSLPSCMCIREVAVTVRQAGFRTRHVVVQTTLLNADFASADDLAHLYRCRWHAELDLRSLKITLGMDILTCKTPDMVRKEIWARFLAYNLIRGVMAQAAHDLRAEPRQFSFKGALTFLREIATRLQPARGAIAATLRDWLFLAIVNYPVGDRPDRIEPRRRKRRPKGYPLLKTTRDEARKRILQAA